MPRNANGVMSLPPGNPVVPGTLIESTWANPTMSDIANELTQSLPRNGSAGMTGPLILARDGQLAKEAVTFEQFTNSISGQNSYLPAGAVQAFAMSAIPTGWLECNGAAVSRATYANLFTTIGTTYGVGNGTTTFNLPDLRGEFIRGWDNGRSIDPSRVLGSNQSPANQAHTHTIPAHDHTFTTGGQSATHSHGVNDPGHAHTYLSATGGPVKGADGGSNWSNVSNTTGGSGTGITLGNANADHTHSGTTSSVATNAATEGTEARPRNVAMVYCIKAFGAMQTDGLGSMAFQNKEAVTITGGSGVFTTLACTTAPVSPTDVVRLSDIGGSMTSIASADTQLILVDNTNPNTPILRPQANVPHGMVKLDAYGKVPNALIDPTGYNYQGTWDASSGLLPGGIQLDGSMYYIDVAGTLDLYHSDGVQSATLCAIGTHIVYVTDSPTLPVPGWYYEPPPMLAGATASQVALVPFGNITATNVQAGMEEVAGDVTSVEADVVAVAGDVGILQGEMTTVEANVTTLQGEMVAVEANVTTLQGEMVAVEADIVDINDKLTGPAFSAYQSTLQALPAGSFIKVLFQTEDAGGDTNSNYDTSTSLFTPTVAGWYQLNSAVNKADVGALIVSIFKNGVEHRRGCQLSGDNSGVVSSLVYLNGVGDYVEIKVLSSSAVNSVAAAALTYFNGFLARAA